MKKRKIIIAFLLLILLLVPVVIPFVPVGAQEPDPIGYKIVGDVVEIWNPDTTYYFNKSSGIQWTEDPEQYWSRNIFAIGYYSGGEWHKIYSADELGTFNKNIDSDYTTYVNATLWKDFTYAGYDLRLGVRYHLKVEDEDLSIIIYAKNIGAEDYPVPLGFAWMVTDIDIPNPKGEDTIYINQTDYRLDRYYDLTFKNMSHTYFNRDLNETVTEFDSHYRIFDYIQFITLEWVEDVPYVVRLRCNGVQEDAIVTWMVNGGIFKAGQEKSTTLYWVDAEGDYTGEHWDIAPSAYPCGITTDGSNIWISDISDWEVYKYAMDGTYTTEHWGRTPGTIYCYGLATDGSNIWVLGGFTDAQVYKFTMAGVYVSSFDTSAHGTDATGLTTDGVNIWVVDDTDEEVYKYTMAGAYVSSFDISAQVYNPEGITTDGTYIWVVDKAYDYDVYKYDMSGNYISSFETDGQVFSPYGLTTDGTYIWVVSDYDHEVYKYVYKEPTITSATITDMDDTDNVYAMESYYSFVAVVNWVDGATDIDKVYLRGKNGAAVLWEVRGDSLTGTASWSIQSGSDIIDLDTGSCTFGEAGDVGTATFKIRTEWDHGNLADLELAVYVEVSGGASAGWTDKQTNYWDAINRLVTSDFATNTTRISQGDGIDLTGTVYYATTIGGNTASLKYPLNAQFIAVHAHNAAHVSHGSDASIVNGAFSIEFIVPDASVENVYHVYLNMAGDYSDADAPDGDTVTIYAAPTITSATITDMDDTDNVYAMKNGYYTFVAEVNDPDGADDIDMVYLQIRQGAAVRVEVRATDLSGTPVYAIQTGATIIDIDAGSCSWGEDGDVGTATFKIQFEWDYAQEADIELAVYVENIYTASAGFTVKQTNYADIITRLVTSGLVANATYMQQGEGVQITGTVYYATTVGGNTASSLYPPDAQYTSVDIHDAGDVERGTDGTIVNGAFSVEFTIPDVVQANVYHVYLDLVDDYSDADAPDGDTVTVYGVGIVMQLSFDDETGSTVNDGTNNNNDGIISGATRTGIGLYGRAISFDGIDDYILVGESASLNITTNIMLSAWIYTDDADVQGIMLKTGAYGLSVISNYGIRFTINSTDFDTSPNVFNASTWTYIAGVYNTSHMLIYIDGVLDTYTTQTGVVATNDNDLFIGNVTTNFFNGTLDEVRLLDYEPSAGEVAGFMYDPIATFPYNLQGIIYDMEATNWVFAQAAYEYQGIYVRQNASYPLDTLRLRFTDGVSWTTVTFDIIVDEWEISSVAAYLVVHENTTSGNEWTITWEIYLTENIFDVLDVDISMYCNDTSARSDTWEVVEADYFNIYSHGGLTEYETSGDGISVAGEGVFGLAAQNSSKPGGSWAYANITWRKLQHINFLFHWWQGTAYNTTLNYWECPTEHADTGYVEYGINYWYDGSWIEGWKVRLTIEDGDAGTHGAATDDAWVKVNASWYNRGSYVKSDLLYAYYEAIESTDTSTQFALFIDLWVGIEGGSSTVGGRVNAEYFGMNETGWGPWATWSPMSGLEDESVFFDDLLDASSYVISAEELEMFTAWALINKTSPDAGDPDCDSHQWGLIDYSGPYWRTLAPTDVMRGISAPVPTPTITPGEVSVGFFSALITAMIEGITKPIVAALGGGARTLSFIMAAIIDSAFGFFNIENFSTTIRTTIGTWGGFLASSLRNLTSIIVQMFRIITQVATFAITWLTRMITLFLDIWRIAGEIWSGTSTAITGLTDMWGLMNIDAWIDAVPIFIAIGWFDSIDKRARRVGGGWMSFFIGDLQMVSWVLSFLVEWFTRVIEFVINRVMQFINILPI